MGGDIERIEIEEGYGGLGRSSSVSSAGAAGGAEDGEGEAMEA